jgi:hypothetical protein
VLFLQVLDVQVQLGAADCRTSPGIVLRTGAVTLISIDRQQEQQQEQRQQEEQHHMLTAAEAAAHLSAVIRQRRIALRLGRSNSAVAGQAAAPAVGLSSGARLDAAAAVAAVEQHLLYQQYELSVGDLQAAAVNLRLPVAEGGGGGSGSPEDGGVGGGSSGFGRHWHPLLQPLRLAGLLKIHRIAEVSCCCQ